MRMSINTPEDWAVNEQFLKLVQETPILWNLHLPAYRNREAKEQKWTEVGAAFNLSGTEAYKKFVALREKYKREQKLRESKSFAMTECWRLYDKMKFLDSVTFSRDRRWSKVKMNHGRMRGGSSSGNGSIDAPFATLMKPQDLVSLIKNELPEMASATTSTPTSRSYALSENESERDQADYFNDSTMQDETSEDQDGVEFEEEKIQSMPDVHPVPDGTASVSCYSQQQNQQQQFLNRLETKTNAILDEHSRRKQSWERCETLGQRVAQTMFALEENDPDLALRFDIIMSEAIASIKKDQLQRLMSRRQQEEELAQRMRAMEQSRNLQQQNQQPPS